MARRGSALDLRGFLQKFYIETMDIQYAMTKPTVVAINGAARGAGMTLGITSDVIIAADHVDLGYPEIDVGLIPAIHLVTRGPNGGRSLADIENGRVDVR